MLKDFVRRLFFRYSTTYFLISFLSACAQIILRTALFVTDDGGARRDDVRLFQAPLNQTATQNLYNPFSDGGFEICRDVPGRCRTLTLDSDFDDPTIHVCPMLAAYSMNLFRDNRLEDIVFIACHIYLVLVTMYALAYESIPHIIFIFAIRCLSAVWALARVIETTLVQRTLVRLVDRAHCGSESDFFGPSFYAHRHLYEGLLFGTSVLSVTMEAFAANRLCRIYSERPWRVVQVSSEMRKMYRLLLGFSVVAQMAGFILPAGMALWVDQLVNTYFKEIVGDHKVVYGAFFLCLTLLLPLWISLGWFALRREWKRSTFVFLGLGVVFLCSYIAGLGSAMFIWTITTWWFFVTIYAVSLALLLAAVVLAVICCRNFGKNLDHYLMVQSRLTAMDFAHAHFEKDAILDETDVPVEIEPELDSKSDSEEDHWGYGLEKRFGYD